MNKLLEAVLKIELENVNVDVTEDKIWYTKKGDTLKSYVPTCKFMLMCKKWAYAIDEYIIETGLDYANLFDRYSCSDSDPIIILTAATEPEVVFKACNWIIDKRRINESNK